MVAPVATASQRRLAPETNNVPTSIAANTSDVPRSGCMATSTIGGTTSAAAPRMVKSPLICASRELIQFASTTAISTLASSENWNCMPAMVTHRAVPPTPVPIASDSTSSPMFTKYSGQANVFEPPVVERGGQQEGDDAEARPDRVPRANVDPDASGRDAGLVAVRVGHHETHPGQQRRVDHELHVEGAPGRNGRLAGPLEPVLLEPDGAHRSVARPGLDQREVPIVLLDAVVHLEEVLARSRSTGCRCCWRCRR